MEILHLKIILLAVMLIIAFLFGLLPMKIYDYVKRKQKNGNGRLASVLLSLLSCLSGGVFLGVCLLDLLPFAHETFEDVKKDTGYDSEYPFVELIVGVGFFFVYFVEEVSLKLCKFQEDNDDAQSCCDSCTECENAREIEVGANCEKTPYTLDVQMGPKSRSSTIETRRMRTTSILTTRIRTTSVIFSARENIAENRSNADDFVKSITFIAAFTFHSTLEGFAFGVQDSTVSVATLFFGIMVHKAVVAFSIGMRLVRCHPERKWFILSLVIFVALTAPIGGGVGIAIQDSKMDAVPKNIVSCVLTCIALGTFLYITFFEILFTEQTNGTPKLLQWFSTLAGFAIIALLMVYGG